MAKHRPVVGHQPKTRTGGGDNIRMVEAKDVRTDTDANGRVIGWAVGRQISGDNYDR